MPIDLTVCPMVLSTREDSPGWPSIGKTHVAWIGVHLRLTTTCVCVETAASSMQTAAARPAVGSAPLSRPCKARSLVQVSASPRWVNHIASVAAVAL